ncbi:MAG: ester cyclase [Chloroflexota bacterium]
MNAQTHRTTLLRISDEGLTPGNLDLLDELIAEDYLVHSPFGDLNREAVKGFFGALRGALTNFKVVRAQIVVEENFASTRSVVTGIFKHEFHGPTGVIAPNGQTIDLQIINIFRFREDGVIVEEWAQFDNLGFLAQLGALPTAPQ